MFAKTTEEDNFVLKPADIAAVITEKTKAFMLTSPSNPNGSCWGLDDLQALADLAVKHDFYIITDEIYEHLLYTGGRNISIATLGEKVKERTIVINGVSKTYAMTGFRIGYAAGPKDVMDAISACQSQATSAPNTPAQYAAMKALTMPQEPVEVFRKAFMERRDALVEGLNAIEGISCLKPDGAFYVMMNVTKLIGRKKNGTVIDSCSTFARMLLEDEKVAVVPGAEFYAPGFCRLTYALSKENIAEGVRRIRAFAESLT